MMARRFAALLLTLLTLHLNLLGADSACPKHGKHGLTVNGESRQTMDGMSSSMQSAQQLSQTHGDGAQHEPCEIPAQSNCCRALISCSIVFSSSEIVSTQSIKLRDFITASASRVPRSEIVAPDPPPPKA